MIERGPPPHVGHTLSDPTEDLSSVTCPRLRLSRFRCPSPDAYDFSTRRRSLIGEAIQARDCSGAGIISPVICSTRRAVALTHAFLKRNGAVRWNEFSCLRCALGVRVVEILSDSCRLLLARQPTQNERQLVGLSCTLRFVHQIIDIILQLCQLLNFVLPSSCQCSETYALSSTPKASTGGTCDITPFQTMIISRLSYALSAIAMSMSTCSGSIERSMDPGGGHTGLR
ncbi:hypothetical protein C8R46DRAFT_1080268 [Mycena filopes]|nr:hypothetical protein C8R46DRAFT_1080268 [Mycena filopes]